MARNPSKTRTIAGASSIDTKSERCGVPTRTAAPGIGGR
jgi:hypothetical protein